MTLYELISKIEPVRVSTRMIQVLNRDGMNKLLERPIQLIHLREIKRLKYDVTGFGIGMEEMILNAMEKK